jgi:hypothetical protein
MDHRSMARQAQLLAQISRSVGASHDHFGAEFWLRISVIELGRHPSDAGSEIRASGRRADD